MALAAVAVNKTAADTKLADLPPTMQFTSSTFQRGAVQRDLPRFVNKPS